MNIIKIIVILLVSFNISYAEKVKEINAYSIYDDPEGDSGYSKIIINDPFETFNRKVYNFNKVFDKHILAPITNIYDSKIPAKGRIVVDNVLSNLREPISLVNHGLQLDLNNVLKTFWRFVFNSTFGLAGTRDFAGQYLNLKSNPNDFENTLAKYCFNHGPYLVLPILGPNTIRGGIGKLTDIIGDPMNFVSTEPWWLVGKSVASVINFRSTHQAWFEYLKDLSVDDYAMVKSVYSQKIFARDLKYKHCKKNR